jgi:hypothetical protein
LRLSVVSYLVGRRRHVLKWCTRRGRHKRSTPITSEGAVDANENTTADRHV